MVKYLCVAEKPSIAKSITQILSGGQFQTRTSGRGPNTCRNYDFTYRTSINSNHLSQFTVTAVSGHLTSTDFEDRYRKWNSCDPFTLFDAQIKHFTTPNERYKSIERNLQNEARRATHLMIWTDCDREGEHIGSEIANVCLKTNPNMIVKRARFNAIIANQINQACRNPGNLDMRQANAVNARIDLDLRLGAAFTREQTLKLQHRFVEMSQSLVSYGPCQFPTLGFVVEQYKRVESFIPEPFWFIHVTIDKDNISTPFNWKRGKLFDKQIVETLLQFCQDVNQATVVSQQTKPTQKWKPLPLTTVELQKTGSRLLRMSPKKYAEGLYQKGFLSYPRTETDQFDPDFNFEELIRKQMNDTAWGQFATDLVNGEFETPRNGKNNDKAHPPIHPIAHANNLIGEEKKVYDLVTRRFLANCSKNAKGLQTKIEIQINFETFETLGLIVLEKNYLNVYVFDQWNENNLPQFELNQIYELSNLEIKKGQTSQPNLLTEADLVSLMDKNGIEHIQKIIDRNYVMKQKQGQIEFLIPSTLGIGLVEGYNSIGFEKSLCKPDMRRITEFKMNQICNGIKTKQQVIEESIEEYKEIFLKTRTGFDHVIQAVAKYIEGDGEQHQSDDGDDRRGARQNDFNNDEDEADDDDDDDGFDDDDHAPPVRANGPARGRGATRGVNARGRANVARGRGAIVREGGRTRTNRIAPNEGDQDDPFNGDHDQKPICNCGQESIEKTVTSNDKGNKGRIFFTCSKGRQEGCGFFQWNDQMLNESNKRKANEPVQQQRPAQRPRQQHQAPSYQDVDQDEDNALRCNCDLTPVQVTTTKEGPNQGRIFLRCPNSSISSRCKFFKWLDELDEQGLQQRDLGSNKGNSNVVGVSRVTSGKCYKCDQEGHWASNCPNQGIESIRPRVTHSNGQQQTGECFICHQEGHWSSNCPNRDNGSAGSSRRSADVGGVGGGGGGGGTSIYSCFKCGERKS
ncbi:DNA topoisomerase [Microbotryomycetes sp. JL221]|nr:DNA topoisomerase [Microbotryomycetes sp. JL221]